MKSNASKKRTIHILPMLFFVLILIASAGAVFLYHLAMPPALDLTQLAARNLQGVTVNTAERYVTFELEKGESAQRAGIRLQDAGLIRSSFLWTIIARLDPKPIKTGLYRIDPPLALMDIRELFLSGRQLLERLTVPEGFTLNKIAELCEVKGICSRAEFIKAARDPEVLKRWGIPASDLEGYLCPDTYYFPRAFSATQVVNIMSTTFFDRLFARFPEAKSLSGEELLKQVILASIVEREYRNDDEAPVIAGVFFNRLKIKMPLQSCATVEFIITELLGKPHPEVLYNQDIEMLHPYNTYIHPGLPPGPISSPGLVALNAVFHPQASDYLYFRLIDAEQGRHHFSKTFDEHLKAGVIYLKSRKKG